MKNEMMINEYENQLSTVNALEIFENNKNPVQLPITYYKIDNFHYSFDYTLNDSVSMTMEESDFNVSNDEFVGAEFNDIVDENEKIYYLVAAGSGLLTGVLSNFDFLASYINDTDDSDKKTSKIKNQIESIIVLASKLMGCKKKDYKSCQAYLFQRIVHFCKEKIPDAIKDIAKSFENELENHPSAVGLLFSIISQFTNSSYYFDDDGTIHEKKLDDDCIIGKNFSEKICIGSLYWVFNMAVDALMSNRNVLDNLNIPKELVGLIKDLVKSKLGVSIANDINEAKKEFNRLIASIFSNIPIEEKNGLIFDIERLIKEHLGKQMNSVPFVVANECIFRAFYMVKRILVELKSVDSISSINIADIMPFDNRIVSNMGLIASGTFMCSNIAGAAIKAVVNKKKAKDITFATSFLVNISIAGLGTFVFHCIDNSKYYKDNFEILFRRKDDKDKRLEINIDFEEYDFNSLTLDGLQAQILYSLEALLVDRDCKETKDLEKRKKKSMWLEEWKLAISTSQGTDVNSYFVSDEDAIYSTIYEFSKDKSNYNWFYLLTMELSLFKPYFQLGSENDKLYKDLKVKSDYIKEVFVRRQTIVTQEEVDKLSKDYSKNRIVISGTAQNTIIGVGATLVVTTLTGALALTFAPGIAILIAGNAVAGLHGAALTSASLALVGGGSLAAGGLGMAGGTAIITGGGALLGLACSGGSATVISTISQTSSDYWINQSARLVTYCNNASKMGLLENDEINKIHKTIDVSINRVSNQIKQLEEENNDLDNKDIKKLKDYQKCLKNCGIEIKKLTNKMNG